MAIDTRAKRQSSGSIGLPFKTPTVFPTGSLTVSARVAAAWYFSGEPPASIVVLVPLAPASRTFLVPEQNREFKVKRQRREFKAEAA